MKVWVFLFLLLLNLSNAQENVSEVLKQQIVEPATFADIVEPLIPTVVNIYTEQSMKSRNSADEFKDLFRYFDMPFNFDEIYSNPQAVSLGSGFIIDKEGYIVTNHHVVDKADKINVKLSDGRELEAKLVGSDVKTDLALLRVNAGQDLPFAILGDDEKNRVGDWVIAIGNPFGFNHTVTKGIISSKARDIEDSSIVNNYIQTDASINRGNSGGPMFNLKGEVIGVTSSIYSPSGSSAGIGFAIPSQTVKKVIIQIKSFGKVTRGLLNIHISCVTPDMIEALGLKKDQKGVVVNSVQHGGAGEKAGLKPGDIIIQFNSKSVASPRELQLLVANTPIGDTAKILVLRKGRQVELTTKIQADDPIKSKETNKISPLELEINGIVFVNANKAGVMVAKISKDSIWRSLKQGDIVVGINQEEVNNIKNLETLYNKSKGRKNIVLMVKRKGVSIFLVLPTSKSK